MNITEFLYHVFPMNILSVLYTIKLSATYMQYYKIICCLKMINMSLHSTKCKNISAISVEVVVHMVGPLYCP
jgi:hypothetical protein